MDAGTPAGAAAAGSARASQGSVDQAGFVLSPRPPGQAAAIVPVGDRDAETGNHTSLLLTVTLGPGAESGLPLCSLPATGWRRRWLV